MKLLQIKAEGLPLFKETLDLCFYAQQRVAEERKEILYPLFSNIYLNPANGFIGVNASGKTSLLKVILLVLGIINNKPVNHIETKDILGDTKKAVFNIFFYSESSKEICRLETIITSKKSKTDGIVYSIISESVWTKKTENVITRKAFLNFEGNSLKMVRNKQENFLPDDVSIIIAHNKKSGEHINVVNLLRYTNINVLPSIDEIPAEVIAFLDPTVERLTFDKKGKNKLIYLKFNGKEEIAISDPIELNNYLSSGTVKGMIAFTFVQEILRTGGYLVMDEIENHFNKEIVVTLMRFFMDKKLNKNGGILIFSTHYPELLDEFERNDGIFVTKNQNGIIAENLSKILKRNDIKKSDAYQSGFLEGTTPMYNAYMRLKKKITSVLP